MLEFKDSFSLSKNRKMKDDGTLVVRSVLTRSGSFDYSQREVFGDGDKTVKIIRGEKVLSDSSFLDSLRGAILTDSHPDDFVSPDDFKKEVVGHVGDDVKYNSTTGEVEATVYVSEKGAISKVERGQNSVSVGYFTKVEPKTLSRFEDGTPSVMEISEGLVANHVSLVPVPRVKGAKLLDASTKEVSMPKEDKKEEVVLTDSVNTDVVKEVISEESILEKYGFTLQDGKPVLKEALSKKAQKESEEKIEAEVQRRVKINNMVDGLKIELKDGDNPLSLISQALGADIENLSEEVIFPVLDALYSDQKKKGHTKMWDSGEKASDNGLMRVSPKADHGIFSLKD